MPALRLGHSARLGMAGAGTKVDVPSWGLAPKDSRYAVGGPHSNGSPSPARPTAIAKKNIELVKIASISILITVSKVMLLPFAVALGHTAVTLYRELVGWLFRLLRD